MDTSIPQSSPDWQTTKGTVRDRTAFLFNNSLMSDIKFVLADSDGTQVRVPAHKLVLAISSPVFEAMFYGELAETREEIELPDTDASCLLEFLRFTYCDEVELTAENVLGVLYVAQKYIVPALVSKCRQFLGEKTDGSNACQIVEEARMFRDSALERKCWEVIDLHTTACLESDRVTNLSHDTLVALLERDTLQIEEINLFQAVERWTEAKCEEESLPKTGPAMRKILGDAVNLIRYPTMSHEEFALHVVPTKILTSDEALEVQRYLSGVTQGTLVSFPCAKRRGVFKTSIRCSRFSASTNGMPSMHDQLTETLTFQTTKMVILTGICLYAGRTMKRQFFVKVKVIAADEKDLTAQQGTYEINYDRKEIGGYGFDVVFESPVQVRPSSKHVICATVKSTDGDVVHFNSRQPQLSVNIDGVIVSFEKTSGIACQILALLLEI